MKSQPIVELLRAHGFTGATLPSGVEPDETVLVRLVATCPACGCFFTDGVQGEVVACGSCLLKGVQSFAPTKMERAKVQVEP